MVNRKNVTIIASIWLLIFSFPVSAEVVIPENMKVKASAFSVEDTLDRLEAVLGKKGITVFARIDHAAGAKKIGSNLAPTQLLIFGNPKLGTPLLRVNQTVGIDLPLKAIAWEDSKGTVWLGYNMPEYIAVRHGISGQEVIIKKMQGALNKLTDHAIGK